MNEQRDLKIELKIAALFLMVGVLVGMFLFTMLRGHPTSLERQKYLKAMTVESTTVGEWALVFEMHNGDRYEISKAQDLLTQATLVPKK